MNIEQNKDKFIYIQKLINHCISELNNSNSMSRFTSPKVKITPQSYCKQYKSFGGYNPQTETINIVISKRNLADVCRTISHELFHHYQKINNQLTPQAGKDGDKFENEANAFSGKTMREFGRENPEIYSMFFE